MIKIIGHLLLIILMLMAHHSALPYNGEITQSNEAVLKAADDCLIHSTNLEDCQSELNDSQISTKVTLCLDGCAHCVKQWQTGIYNGRSCALDCVQQIEKLEPPVDPDCNLVKYFNSSILNQLELSTT